MGSILPCKSHNSHHFSIDTKNCGKIPGGGNGVVIPGDVQYVKVECHNELKVQVWKDFFPLVPSPRNLSPGTKTKAKFWDEQKLKSNPNKKTSSIFPPSVLVIGEVMKVKRLMSKCFEMMTLTIRYCCRN